MTVKSATPNPASNRFLTGLLGAPIAQSASPAMHERAAAALGVHCHYQLIEVAGAGREELKMLLEGVRRLGFAGINVTFPYKEAVLDLLDELSPRAALIGAVTDAMGSLSYALNVSAAMLAVGAVASAFQPRLARK